MTRPKPDPTPAHITALERHDGEFRRRADILALLARPEHVDGLSVTHIARHLRRDLGTVSKTLRRLQAEGDLTSARATPTGRGKPPTLYRLTSR